MAFNPHLAEFLTKTMHVAISEIKEGDAPDGALRVAQNVAAYRHAGYISDDQLDFLSEAIGHDIDVPDDAADWDADMASLRSDVSDNTEAIIDLSVTVDSIVNPEPEEDEVEDGE